MSKSANAVIGDLAKRFVDTVAETAVLACREKTTRSTILWQDIECAARTLQMEKIKNLAAKVSGKKLASQLADQTSFGCLSSKTFKNALVMHGAIRVSERAVKLMGLLFEHYIEELIPCAVFFMGLRKKLTITTRSIRDAIHGGDGQKPAWGAWGKAWMVGGVTGDHSFKRTEMPLMLALSARRPIRIVASSEITWGMGPFAR